MPWCNECGEPIRYVEMDSGSRMPVDVPIAPPELHTVCAKPRKGHLTAGYVVTVMTPAKLRGWVCYRPHWPACRASQGRS